jgi:hypothetical protein
MVPLSLTGRILQTVVRFSCARPALTVSVAVLLAALGIGYAAHSLTLETSKFHLLPLHHRYAALYKDYAEDFGQLEDIVVVVESPATETSTAYAARLATALRDGGLGTARISYRIDASRLEAHALLYLPLDTLRTPSTRSRPTKRCSPTSPPCRRSTGWWRASTSPSAQRSCRGSSVPVPRSARTGAPRACCMMS